MPWHGARAWRLHGHCQAGIGSGAVACRRLFASKSQRNVSFVHNAPCSPAIVRYFCEVLDFFSEVCTAAARHPKRIARVFFGILPLLFFLGCLELASSLARSIRLCRSKDSRGAHEQAALCQVASPPFSLIIPQSPISLNPPPCSP